MRAQKIIQRQHRHQHLWAENAAVIEHRDTIQQLDRAKYYPEYDDFVKEYLPFYSADVWVQVDEEKRKQLLSFGWFMYNLKTIIIEQSVLTEYCKIVLSGCSSFAFTKDFVHRLAQVQVDEAYHTLMSYKGIDMCDRLKSHDLTIFPDTDLAIFIDSLKTLNAPEKELALLALTGVCEATISKYLSAFPSNDSVQPALRFITNMHCQDEATHSSMFIDMMAIARDKLSGELNKKFIDYIRRGMVALTSPDRKTWQYLHGIINAPLAEKHNPYYEKLFNFRALEKHVLKDSIQSL